VRKRTRIHAWLARRAGALSIAGVLMASIATVTCVACSTESQPSPGVSVTKVPDPGDVIGEELMIALAQAKNFHHKAKVYMSDGNLADATASVRQILSLRFPAGAPEAEDVRLDARARLAKLLVSQGQLEEAMRTASEGLAQASRESFFVANLHTVQGEVHEARAAQLEAAIEKTADDEQRKQLAKEVAAEKRAAIAAYDRSIKINEALQKRLMEGR
jgi:tetratricopeptide (TPR) repeat protein